MATQQLGLYCRIRNFMFGNKEETKVKNQRPTIYQQGSNNKNTINIDSEIQAENYRLLQENDRLKKVIRSYKKYTSDLLNENAKLESEKETAKKKGPRK